MIQIEFSPSVANLIDSLSSEELQTGETIIDAWFRLTCVVKIRVDHEAVTIDDDMGFFFQKWMLLVKERVDAGIVYFMGSRASMHGSNLVLRQRGHELVLSKSDARLCSEEVANELQQQLDVMLATKLICENDINHYKQEYLFPIRQFASS